VPIVYANLMWPSLPELYELMEARPNVYLETGLLHTYRSIEYISQRFGAERIIFGTGFRSNNGAFIATLAHADATPEQAALIAHGNLERLLGAEPSTAHVPSRVIASGTGTSGESASAGYHRRAHAPSRGSSGWDHRTDFDAHVQDAQRLMDRMGVALTIVAGMDVAQLDALEGTPTSKSTWPLRRSLPRLLRLPSRHRRQACPAPRRLLLATLLGRLQVLCDYWRIPVTDPRFAPMWEYADQHALPVLIHTWSSEYNSPRMLFDIAPRYPHAVLLLGHSGADHRPDAEALVLENPNVYLEWCGSFTYPAAWKLPSPALVSSPRLRQRCMGHDPAWEWGACSRSTCRRRVSSHPRANMRDILARRR